MDKFQQLSDSSKVWVYTASRELSPSEIEFARKEIDIFAQNWAAHGSALTALGDVLENRFVALLAIRKFNHFMPRFWARGQLKT